MHIYDYAPFFWPVGVVFTNSGSASFFSFSAFAFFSPAAVFAPTFADLAASLASFASLLASFFAIRQHISPIVLHHNHIYSTHLRSWNSAQRRQLAVRASTGPIPGLGSRSAWISVFGPDDEMAGAVRTDIDAPEASTRILRRRSHLQNRDSWEMSRSHGFSRESRCGDVTRRRGRARLVACTSQASICSPDLSSVWSWVKMSQLVG